MALPAWTNGVLLENRFQIQLVRGELDLEPNILVSRQLDLISPPDNPSELRFSRQGISGIATINSTENALIITTDDFSIPGADQNGLTVIYADVITNNVGATSFNSTKTVIPSSIDIIMERFKPGPPPHYIPVPDPDAHPKETPTIVAQGQITLIDTSKIVFEYPFLDGIPNNTSFDLVFFANPQTLAFFLKNIDGTNNIPGATLTLVGNILTIAGIPPINGNCSGMLFLC